MTDRDFELLLELLDRLRNDVYAQLDRMLRPILFRRGQSRVLTLGCCDECLEDVVQETLFGGYRSLLTFRGRTPAELCGFFRRIFDNKASDHVKKCVRRREQFGHELPPGGPATTAADTTCSLDQVELAQRIQDALERLSEMQREALRLREGGLSYAELAPLLGCTPEAARQRVTSARENLAGFLLVDPATLGIQDD